jgi:hypothetical protein
VSAPPRSHHSRPQSAGVLRHDCQLFGLVRVALASLVMLITGCGRLGYALLEQQTDPAGDPFAGDGDGDLDGVEGVPPEAGAGDGDGAGDGVGDGDGDAAEDAGVDAATPEPEARTFAEVCDFDALAVIQDGDLIDDASGVVLRSALAARCLDLGGARTVSQDDPGILDATSGRLLLGPAELALVAGGPAKQRALTYLDERALSPIVRADAGPSTYELLESATGRVVLSVPASTITLSHEYAVVMMAHEPLSDTTMFSVYGFESMGTLAGASWFSSALIDEDKEWYVVEWTDSDGDGEPGAGDTFTVIASG